MKPQRIQLSRAKGWRMPPNTVKVDRSTKWGNPFVVGANGTVVECVYQFELLVSGYTCISNGHACCDRQRASIAILMEEKRSGWPTLRGKNLACWCPIGKPCHADVLFNLANGNIRKARADHAAHVEIVAAERAKEKAWS